MNSIRIRIELDLTVCGNDYEDYENFIRNMDHKFEQIYKEYPYSIIINDWCISTERTS